MSLLKQLNDLRNALGGVEGLPDGVLGQVDTLVTAATPLEGIDPEAARTAIAELNQLRPQLEELRGKAGQVDTLQGSVSDLTTQNHEAKRQLLAARTLNTAGILSEFHDLLEPAIAGAAVLDEQTGAFGLPDNYLDALKQKYPSAFAADDAAGTGGAANEGAAPENQTTTYEVGSDRVISGVDPGAVLNGSVQLK